MWKVILFISLYLVGAFICSVVLTVTDYKRSSFGFEDYIYWKDDEIFNYLGMSLLWPIVLPVLIIGYSWSAIVKFILSKINKEETDD